MPEFVGLASNPDPPPELPPRHVFICSGCGESICEGDWYWDYDGEQYCEDCNDAHRHTAVVVEPYE